MKATKVADLEAAIREFEGMASALDRQIKAEEDRTRIRNPTHFAYSNFAKSAMQRRDNLRASAASLKVKLEEAMRERDNALKQLDSADGSTPTGSSTLPTVPREGIKARIDRAAQGQSMNSASLLLQVDQQIDDLRGRIHIQNERITQMELEARDACGARELLSALELSLREAVARCEQISRELDHRRHPRGSRKRS